MTRCSKSAGNQGSVVEVKAMYGQSRAEAVTKYLLETAFIRLVINELLLFFSCWETSGVPSLGATPWSCCPALLPQPVRARGAPRSPVQGEFRGQICHLPLSLLCCSGSTPSSDHLRGRGHLHGL